MSPLLLLAAALPASAGIELGGVITIQASEGVDAEAAQALLPGTLVEACVSGGISSVLLGAEVTATPDAGARIAWAQAELPTKLARIQTCVDGALQAALPPVLGDPAARLTLEVGYGRVEDGKLVNNTSATEGALGPAAPPLTPEQAAAGLDAEGLRTDGIDAAALSTAVLAQRAALGACYTGPTDGGRVSLNVDWTKKEQYAKLVGYTSGMEETGACAQGVLKSIPLREAPGAKKSGRGAVELTFAAPE